VYEFFFFLGGGGGQGNDCFEMQHQYLDTKNYLFIVILDVKNVRVMRAETKA
jgi:hypothetical protein